MKKANTSQVWRFLFLVYCGIMVWLLFRRSNDYVAGVPYKLQLQQNANLTPFYTINNYIHVLRHSGDSYLRAHCFTNLGGNVLLFIPAGWLLPRLWPRMRNFIRFFALCTGVMFLVESIQLLTLLGRFDVDDLILNLTGMTVGFLLYALSKGK